MRANHTRVAHVAGAQCRFAHHPTGRPALLYPPTACASRSPWSLVRADRLSHLALPTGIYATPQTERLITKTARQSDARNSRLKNIDLECAFQTIATVGTCQENEVPAAEKCGRQTDAVVDRTNRSCRGPTDRSGVIHRRARGLRHPSHDFWTRTGTSRQGGDGGPRHIRMRRIVAGTLGLNI